MKNNKAFTLVELVIVIAVIAILASVLLPTFAGILNRAKENTNFQRATSARDEFLSLYANSIVDIEGYIIQIDNSYYRISENGSLIKSPTLEDIINETNLTYSTVETELTNVTIYKPTGEVERIITGGVVEGVFYDWAYLKGENELNTVYVTVEDGVLISTSTLLESIIIDGKDVKKIASQAFLNNTNLTSVQITTGVNSIEKNAFLYCSNLTTLTIDEGLTRIEDSAINGSPITNISIPNSLDYIGLSAIKNYQGTYLEENNIKYLGNETNPYVIAVSLVNKNQTTHTINKNCKILGEELFYKNQTTSMTIPSGIKFLGYNCFSDTKLTSVYISDTVKACYGNPFLFSKNLTQIIVDENNPYLESRNINMIIEKSTNKIITAGINSKLENCGTINIIGKQAFALNTMTTLTIPDTVTSIESNAFIGCSKISVLDLGSVTYIGPSAFSQCTSLTRVVIPNTVTQICENAFSNCTNLTYVTMSANIKLLGDFAFDGCSKLQYSTYNNGKYFVDDSGKYVALMGFVNTSITSFTFSNDTRVIYGFIFMDTNVRNLILPNSLQSIGDEFIFTSTLQWIVIDENVEVITSYAFQDCTSLKKVYYKGSEEMAQELKNNYQKYFNDAPSGFAIYTYSETQKAGCWYYNSNGVPTLY